MDVKKWNIIKHELEKYEKKYQQAVKLENQIVTSIDNVEGLINSIAKATSENVLVLEEQLEEAILYTKDLLARFEVIDLTLDEINFKNLRVNVTSEHDDYLNSKLAEYNKYSNWKNEQIQILNKKFIKDLSLVKKQALYDSSNDPNKIWEKSLEEALEQNKKILDYVNKANLILEEMYSCPFHVIMKLKKQRIEYLHEAEHILNKLKMELNHYA